MFNYAKSILLFIYLMLTSKIKSTKTKKMNKQLIFFCLCCLLSIIAHAQFREGFIITTSSDTIHGYIKYKGAVYNTRICEFRNFSKENIIKYSPKDIKEYRFNNGKYFISKEIDGENIFLEYLIKGRANLYTYSNSFSDTRFFLKTESDTLLKLTNTKEIKVIDNNSYEVEKKSFKKPC
jgi:hypothetical protein